MAEFGTRIYPSALSVSGASVGGLVTGATGEATTFTTNPNFNGETMVCVRVSVGIDSSYVPVTFQVRAINAAPVCDPALVVSMVQDNRSNLSWTPLCSDVEQVAAAA